MISAQLVSIQPSLVKEYLVVDKLKQRLINPFIIQARPYPVAARESTRNLYLLTWVFMSTSGPRGELSIHLCARNNTIKSARVLSEI